MEDEELRLTQIIDLQLYSFMFNPISADVNMLAILLAKS